jgi:hypothetical protein
MDSALNVFVLLEPIWRFFHVRASRSWDEFNVESRGIPQCLSSFPRQVWSLPGPGFCAYQK